MRLSCAPLPGSLVQRLAAPPGEPLTLVWLGQAGWVVDGAGMRVVIDAYLSDSLVEKYRGSPRDHRRLMPVPVDPGAIRHVDAVLGSHAHGDHLDPGTLPALLAANPQAVLVAPAHSAADALARAAIAADRLRPIDAGQNLVLAPGLRVTATRAAHEGFETDAEGRHRWLGLALRLAGATLFHAGDTVPYEGQAEEVRALGADLALLPVNGRGKGVPGNLTADEALALARAAGVRSVLLHHFGMFAFNTAHLSDLEALAAGTADLRVEPARMGILYRLDRSRI